MTRPRLTKEHILDNIRYIGTQLKSSRDLPGMVEEREYQQRVWDPPYQACRKAWAMVHSGSDPYSQLRDLKEAMPPCIEGNRVRLLLLALEGKFDGPEGNGTWKIVDGCLWSATSDEPIRLI